MSVDLDKNGYISDYELNELLRAAGHPLPGYMVREIIQKLDRDHDNRISFDEFLLVCPSRQRFPHCELGFVLFSPECFCYAKQLSAATRMPRDKRLSVTTHTHAHTHTTVHLLLECEVSEVL